MLRNRGFTLMETMVVVAVASIAAGLSLAALTGLKERTAYNSAVSMMVSDLKTARWRALAEGRTMVVVGLRDTSGDRPDRYLVIADVDGDFDPLGFDPDPVEPMDPEVLVADRTFEGGAAFGPGNGFGKALPAPFSGVPANIAATFAQPATGGGAYDLRGAIFFDPDGTLRLGDSTFTGSRTSGSLSITDLTNPSRITTIAFVGQTGAVKAFSR